MTTSNGKTFAAPWERMGLTVEQYRSFAELAVRHRETVVNAMSLSRADLRRGSGGLDRRRDYDDECGYPKVPTIEDYQRLYERNGVARRVNNFKSKECWQVTPWVYEKEKSSASTRFEKAVEGLHKQVRGEKCWYKGNAGSPVWEALARLDRLAGLGRYGALLYGFDDGLPLHEPVAGVAEENSYPGEFGTAAPDDVPTYRLSNNAASKSNRNLVYLRVFTELLAPVTRWETNPYSPRFMEPVEYELRFASPHASIGTSEAPVYSSRRVHWTRVLHYVDGLESSHVLGTPRLQPHLNRLADLTKLYGGSPEAYWQAIATLFLTADADTEIDIEGTRDQVERMFNGLQRYAALRGIEPKNAAPAVTDPTPHIKAQLEAIAIGEDAPMRILMGSERGELSSAQDAVAWAARVKERQDNQLTPCLVVPFFDRLILVGALPAPVDGFLVDWPSLVAESASDKSSVLAQRTDALTKYDASPKTVMAPLDYLTREMGYDDEEAEAIVEAAEEYREEEEKRAEEKQAKMMEQAAAAGMGPDGKPLPTEGGPPQPGTGQNGEDIDSILAELEKELAGATRNAFCPTGEGGGVDPSCSPMDISVSQDDRKNYTTTFKVGGKEFFFGASKDEEGWHVGFGLTSRIGGDTARMEHDPNTSPIQVLRHVQRSLEMFITDKQPDTILFTGEKSDKSRVRLYDRLVGDIGKTYGYTHEVHDYPALKEYILKRSGTLAKNNESGFSANADDINAILAELQAELAGATRNEEGGVVITPRIFRLVANAESFFAECARDERGRCTSGGGGAATESKAGGLFARLKGALGLAPKDPGNTEGQGSFKTPEDSKTVQAILSGKESHDLHSGLASSKEDTALTAIMKEVGKDGLPTLASKEQIDELGKKGWSVCYRGVGDAKYAEQFKTGKDMYNGAGTYGNGSYFCEVGKTRSEADSKAGAEMYANINSSEGKKGAVLRVAFPPGAKIGDHETVKAEQSKYLNKLASDRFDNKITKEEYEAKRDLHSDVGRFAALNNYDAVRVKHDGFLLVLNRKKCVVEK